MADEKIESFLHLASATPNKFRAIAKRASLTVSNPAYIWYEFNPLKKRPLVRIAQDRWVAPNRLLIFDRVSWGIYYDLLDADHKEFTEAFGLVFQECIGSLLKSVYPTTSVLPEKEYGHKKQKKHGPADWSVIEDKVAILFECKAFIPNLNFVSIAGPQDIQEYAGRIAGALEQTYNHIQSIQAGEPGLEAFVGLDTKVVVLTMGHVQTVNTVFFKSEIDRILGDKGIHDFSYVVWSIQELEQLLSLVERGISLTEVLERYETEELGNVLKPYRKMLSKCALPSLIRQKGKEITNPLFKTTQG